MGPATRYCSLTPRGLFAGCLMLAFAACTPTRFETTSDVPPPLIDKIPVVIGVHLPLEFREKVYEEKREGGGRYTIGLGKAQTAGFMRIMEAMFARRDRRFPGSWRGDGQGNSRRAATDARRLRVRHTRGLRHAFVRGEPAVHRAPVFAHRSIERKLEFHRVWNPGRVVPTRQG